MAAGYRAYCLIKSGLVMLIEGRNLKEGLGGLLQSASQEQR